ncbi:hypothetical protein EIN_402620, partial [Entamoeba invadens IP1]
MNQRIIDLFNTTFQNITALTTFDTTKERTTLQAKKESEDAYHNSEDYKHLLQQITLKKQKISENDKAIEHNKELAVLKNKIDSDKHHLQICVALKTLLTTRIQVETNLAIVSSTSCTEESLKDLLSSLNLYSLSLSQEMPSELTNQFTEYKETYQTYLNKSMNVVSMKLSNLMKSQNFPKSPLTETTKVKSYTDFLQSHLFAQTTPKSALSNALMTSTILLVQQLFQREDSKLYAYTSLDLVIPYIR